MGRRRYPQAVHDFIRANVKGTKNYQLLAMLKERFDLDMTDSQLRSYKKNHNLQSGTSNGMPKGYSRLYSQEVQAYIWEIYKGRLHREIARMVNERFGTAYTEAQIGSFLANRHMDTGLRCRFLPGHVPFNKGMKGWSAPGTERTRFKPGNAPSKMQPVGSIHQRSDGYLYEKVADPNRWRPKHLLEWERVNGPVPKGYRVVFKDRNHANWHIENLMLVSLSQLATMNHQHLWGDDPASNEAYAAIAELKNAIGKARKRRKGDKGCS